MPRVRRSMANLRALARIRANRHVDRVLNLRREINVASRKEIVNDSFRIFYNNV